MIKENKPKRCQCCHCTFRNGLMTLGILFLVNCLIFNLFNMLNYAENIELNEMRKELNICNINLNLKNKEIELLTNELKYNEQTNEPLQLKPQDKK